MVYAHDVYSNTNNYQICIPAIILGSILHLVVNRQILRQNRKLITLLIV
jgi:Na+/citrate or Na+/malate symporter